MAVMVSSPGGGIVWFSSEQMKRKVPPRPKRGPRDDALSVESDSACANMEVLVVPLEQATEALVTSSVEAGLALFSEYPVGVPDTPFFRRLAEELREMQPPSVNSVVAEGVVGDNTVSMDRISQLAANTGAATNGAESSDAATSDAEGPGGVEGAVPIEPQSPVAAGGVTGDASMQTGENNSVGPEVLAEAECHSGSEETEPSIIFPPEELSYEEELLQIWQELLEYCDNHSIPLLHFPVVEPVRVQGKGVQYSVSSAVAQFVSITIYAEWFPEGRLHPEIVGPALNTVATLMGRVMVLPLKDLSWTDFAYWLEACRAFSSIGFFMDQIRAVRRCVSTCLLEGWLGHTSD
ncbi:PREDICTED: uncharacterized protein LOC104605347 [Nelumbo nucifera]|uniref:Uncharacterized protein LOC104605347 n=1 Tax=Nelumbo nucifera TaxID=4432 RepID=A0A1U8ALY2_NELNU|nr:PREDICTED: uncharacterized protein LOC104605347 [Nelumbo nucifera]